MNMRRVESALWSFQEARGLVRAMVLVFEVSDKLRARVGSHNPPPTCDWVSSDDPDHDSGFRCRMQFATGFRFSKAEMSVAAFSLEDNVSGPPEFGIVCTLHEARTGWTREIWLVERQKNLLLYEIRGSRYEHTRPEAYSGSSLTRALDDLLESVVNGFRARGDRLGT